jgi:hypothetical protein
VPGASIGIDRLLKKFDRESEFANGIRISTADSLPIIKMAAFGRGEPADDRAIQPAGEQRHRQLGPGPGDRAWWTESITT